MVTTRIGQYRVGRCVKPSDEANGEYGSQIPHAMMGKVVNVSARLAWLWIKGILLVRMTRMMRRLRPQRLNKPAGLKQESAAGIPAVEPRSITKKVASRRSS